MKSQGVKYENVKFSHQSLARDAAQKQSAIKNDDAKELEIRALKPTMKYEGCSKVETLAGVISKIPITKASTHVLLNKKSDIDDDRKLQY